MPMKDLHNYINPRPAIDPQSVANNTALVGAIIDIQGFHSLEYIISTGSIADADVTFTVLLEDGDNSSLTDAAAVADSYLLGTEALATPLFSDDSKTFKLGYVGNKRYTRLTITPAGNASAALFSAVAILGHPDLMPTVNPPA